MAYADNIALWQSAVAVNPHHPRAWNNLGSAYRTAQNWSEAQRCFEQALALKPDDKFALTQLPIVLASIAADDKNTAREERAIALAEELIRLNPDLPRPRLAFIKLLDKLGSNERAEQACQQLVHDLQQPGELSRKAQKRPRWDMPMLEGSPLAETHFLWGMLLKKRQAWEACLTHFAVAEALAPAEASVYFQQGVVLMELQRTDEALAKYQAAIRCECSHESSWNNLAMLLAKQGQTIAAAHAYQQALYWKPQYPEALDNFGNLYARAKKYREAIALYERALAIDAEYQPAQQHLATAKQRMLQQAPSTN
jgi:tetratricopeptide (TPR) repeat protein